MVRATSHLAQEVEKNILEKKTGRDVARHLISMVRYCFLPYRYIVAVTIINKHGVKGGGGGEGRKFWVKEKGATCRNRVRGLNPWTPGSALISREEREREREREYIVE